jgi:hypothetical protein
MCARIATCLLVLALLVHGAVAVGADIYPDEHAQQHCPMDHDAAHDGCPCCDDAGPMGAGCTVQCSTSQAPVLMIAPTHAAVAGERARVAARTIRNPSYTPLIPPPIS